MNKHHASLAALVLVVLTGPSISQADCVDVIRASRLTTTIARSAGEIEEASRAFCNEYDSLKQNNSAAGGALAYGVLAASFSTGTASLEQVRERYCDAANSRKAKSDAFRSYADLIAPGAYSAYEKCLELKNIGVGISIDPASVLPNSLTAAVSYKAPIATNQTLSYSASPDVKCSWLSSDGATINLTNGSSSLLNCTRERADIASYVQILATTSPGATLSFPWSKFRDGQPEDQMASLRSELGASLQALAVLRDSLKSSVVAFELNACPPGWREYLPAQGRFIRGLDKGFGIDPQAGRLAGSLQGDELVSHSHTRPRDVYDAGNYKDGGAACNQCLGYGHSNGPDTGTFGGSETRPKNVALLYCTPN